MTAHHFRRIHRAIFAATMALSLVAVACSGAAESTTDANATAAASMAPTTAATEAATTAATEQPTAAPTTGSTSGAADDLVTQGKVVFETAGGVGCIYCHGPTGRGDGVANQGAADIRGLDKARVQGALSGGVPLMGFIKLTPAELNAVAAYVKSLAGQ